ncbi:MAG TPA: alkaline phosphatase family protein [Candidatus Baltobacteraceae bacterium]|nr:alkaline phosphatase family protein [Candidatus Baltobacteraceae bacterium]
MRSKVCCGILAALCLIVTGCGSQSPVTSALPNPPAETVLARGPARYIKHIVIAVQENRSFDNVFDGFPGADTSSSGIMSNGRKRALTPIPFEVHDMDHGFSAGVMDWDNGKMDKFDLNQTSGGQTIGRFAYSYLERSAVEPYWTIAKRYVLADHMFPTMFGPSFTGHLTLIAGTADLNPTESEADVPTNSPWGCDAPSSTTTSTVNTNRVVAGNGPMPCFTQFRTMADTLDAAGVSWRYYAPAIGSNDSGNLWSAFDAISNVRHGADWSRVVSPPQQILKDAAHGKLANVSWVVPDFDWSDHPYSGTPYGPSWIASIVNAVGKSPQWRSTAIIVVWDDWGGFYDNVPPPQKDFRGLGIRVGCLIVSPYVRPHVSHTVYEFGSILKFVEQTFGLPPLGPRGAGYTDQRAHSIANSFDFSQRPRAFKKIPTPYPASFFLTRKPSLRAPDDE